MSTDDFEIRSFRGSMRMRFRRLITLFKQPVLQVQAGRFHPRESRSLRVPTRSDACTSDNGTSNRFFEIPSLYRSSQTRTVQIRVLVHRFSYLSSREREFQPQALRMKSEVRDVTCPFPNRVANGRVSAFGLWISRIPRGVVSQL